MTPVLCGSAFKNKGVQPLLDAIIALLPSPLEVDAVDRRRARQGRPEGDPATRPADDDAPFAALAFKVMTDPFSASSPTSASTPASSKAAAACSTSAPAAPSGSAGCC